MFPRAVHALQQSYVPREQRRVQAQIEANVKMGMRLEMKMKMKTGYLHGGRRLKRLPFFRCMTPHRAGESSAV